MKIVIAPDSYKESLSALEVAQAVETGFRAVFPQADYVLVPVADGGEGTVEALVAATQGRRLAVEVSGPLGHPVVYYDMGEDNFVECLYCDRRFVLAAGAHDEH